MNKRNYGRWGAAVGVLIVLLLVASPVLGAMPWTRISKLLVEDEGYALGTWQVDGASTLASLTVSGATALNGGLTMDTSAFTVADATGNVATAGTIGQTVVNAASGSANPYDWTGTLGIMNGSDTFQVFDINLTNADHTSTGNVVEVLNVANITGDADATETAINIGTGWDAAIAVDSPVTVGGGYGSTGCTLSTAGALSCNDAVIAGGGYADTGVTLSAAGVGQFAGALTTDGALTSDSAVVGGGYGAAGCTVSNAGALSCNDAVIAGGGYADTGCTMSAAGVLQCAGAATTDGALTADSGVFGGGYGAAGCTVSNAGALSCNDAVIAGGGYADTGCTLSAAGVLQCAGAATTDGALTADSGVFGGGYGTTGCTVSNAGALSCNDAVIAGGGFGDTGVTISAAGIGQFDGALTTSGALTADNLVCTNAGTFGGGYGSTGCTISTAGVLQCDGAATFGSDVAITALTDGNDKQVANEISGAYRIRQVGLAGGTNPAAATVALFDDSPHVEWADKNARTEGASSEVHFRNGTTSLGVNFGATVAVADGVAWDTSGGALNWTDAAAAEYVGMWLYCDRVLAGGDLTLVITDSVAGRTATNFPTYTTANTWAWKEIDISGVVDTSKDVINALSIEYAAGAKTFNCWFDAGYKWLATDEDTFAPGTTPIRDGVKSICNTVTGVCLTEYTDYVVLGETGSVAWITDQSTAILLALVEY